LLFVLETLAETIAYRLIVREFLTAELMFEMVIEKYLLLRE
jgi:hypothetical protein